MNQVQILVNIGARIRTKGSNRYNRSAFVTLATQYRNSFTIHRNGRLIQLTGDIEIIGE